MSLNKQIFIKISKSDAEEGQVGVIFKQMSGNNGPEENLKHKTLEVRS